MTYWKQDKVLIGFEDDKPGRPAIAMKWKPNGHVEEYLLTPQTWDDITRLAGADLPPAARPATKGAEQV